MTGENIVRNETLKEEMGVTYLMIRGVENRVLRWYGHIEQMKEEGLPKEICRTGHHKGKGEEGNLHMSIKGRNLFLTLTSKLEVIRDCRSLFDQGANILLRGLRKQ